MSTVTYRGYAQEYASLDMLTLTLSKPKFDAVVTVIIDDEKPKRVYRRKCLNKTHAERVATEYAKRFDCHFRATGKRYELRGEG